MKTIPELEGNDKSLTLTWNYSDDELILEELYTRCQALEEEILKISKVRENWLIINEKNEKISKSLQKIQTDCEGYKSNLYKTLFELNLSMDKHKILFRKKSDEYFEKRKAFEAYYEVSPVKNILKELTDVNKILEEEWKNKIGLYELTKSQYYGLLSFLIQTFKNKVCEFCEEIIRLKTNNN